VGRNGRSQADLRTDLRARLRPEAVEYPQHLLGVYCFEQQQERLPRGKLRLGQGCGYLCEASEAYAWSVRMEGYGGPAQPSPTIAQCLSGGYGWLEVKCHRCESKASIPLEHVRRPRSTPIWKLESAFRCRLCGTRRYKPPVQMVKLTEEREITPYKWVHPDDER
jgi:hypothetical protein